MDNIKVDKEGNKWRRAVTDDFKAVLEEAVAIKDASDNDVIKDHMDELIDEASQCMQTLKDGQILYLRA